jgi:Protein of unknown function (DUF2892)
MKKNMGSTDSIVRLALAVAMVGLFLSGIVTGVAGYVLLALAGVFAVTSVVRFCPLYALFGMSTCPLPDKRA